MNIVINNSFILNRTSERTLDRWSREGNMCKIKSEKEALDTRDVLKKKEEKLEYQEESKHT